MKKLLALLLLVPFTSCTIPTLRVAPRYAQYEISGDASLSSGPATGSLDVEQAGLEDDQAVGGRADLKMGLVHIIAGVDVPEFAGRGTLSTTISDGTNTIAQNTVVDSEMNLSVANGLVVFDIIPGDTLEIGLGAGAVYLNLDQSYTDFALSTSVASEEDFAIPVLAGFAAVQLGAFEIGALVSGVQLDLDGDEVFYLNGDIYGRLRLFGGSKRVRGSLVVGYWLTEMDVDYDDGSTLIDVDVMLQAPYVGLEVSL